MLSAERLSAGAALSNDLDVPAVQRPDRWHGRMDGNPLAQWNSRDGETEDDVKARLRTEAQAAFKARS